MSRCARKEGTEGLVGWFCSSQSENFATSLSIGRCGGVGGDSYKLPIFSNHLSYRKL